MSDVDVIQQLEEFTKAFKEFLEQGDVANMQATLIQVKVLEGRAMHEMFKINQSIKSLDITSNDKFLKLSNLKDNLQLVRKYKTGMDSNIKSGEFMFKIKEFFQELQETEAQEDIPVQLITETPTETPTITPIKSSETTMILFHKEGCPFCDEMMDEWIKFINENEYTSNLTIKTVECTQGTKGHKYAQKFGINGYPTIMRFRNGKMDEFTGDRTAQNFKNFALN